MFGQLLGLGDIIGKAFEAVFMFILKPIIRILMDFVIAPLLSLAFEIISYAVGAVAYVISSFLLQLIDFVELLFRALAGLDTAGSPTGMNVELSLDGDTGDILIQLIRNPDIQQAFIAMCVVGLFLLVVTTVFQVIKTEYTTEGAKNAKGPIYQKAFKGLANLMLLPILVIFGIVFANQLLGLLDKATSIDGDNPTISGLLFVASASEAHYTKDEAPIEDLHNASDVLDIIICGIVKATDVFIDNLGNDDPQVGISSEANYLYGDKIDEIEEGFISQSEGHRYYSIGNVNEYYNYAHINYLLLLFGGVFVLKALFFTCFGMVIRLYKCAMLFIIAPAIIGMTPINEGGLGKWRTAFIGQVLSAYGTVLSLNLFFIIVRVLLSIEVKFTSTDAWGTSGAFGSSFMTMLLKAIFVLAGCLLIEKFSKEIGGYFGAEDAMSAGKDMAGQVGDLAMKGVKTAAMVGTGGAMLAVKAGKAAGGIASKVGSGVKNSKLGQRISAGNAAYKASMEGSEGLKSKDRRVNARAARKMASFAVKQKQKDEKLQKKNEGKFLGAMDEYNMRKEMESDAKNEFDLANANYERARDAYGDSDEHVQKLKQKRDEASSKLETARGEKKLAYTEWQDLKESTGISTKSMVEKRKVESAQEKEKFEAERKKKQERGDKVMSAFAGFVGLGEEGKKLMPFRKYTDQFDKAQDTGAKVMGDAYEAAVKSKRHVQGKKIQDFYHDEDPITSRLAAMQNARGAEIATTQIVKEAQFMNARIETSGNDELRNLGQTLANLPKEFHAQQIEATRLRMQNMGIDLEHNQVQEMALKMKDNPKMEFTLKDFKVDFDPEKINQAVQEALKNGGNTPEAIQEAVKKVFADIASTGNAPLMKMLQDVIAKVMNDTPK